MEIPRYSDGLIVGQRTPTETYNDIQSLRPIISKTGHWHYEGQHDFLTFNLKDAIEDAFAKSQTNNNNLFLFLVSTFFGYLRIDIDNCIKKEYVKVVSKALSDQNIKCVHSKSNAYLQNDYGVYFCKGMPPMPSMLRPESFFQFVSRATYAESVIRVRN